MFDIPKLKLLLLSQNELPNDYYIPFISTLTELFIFLLLFSSIQADATLNFSIKDEFKSVLVPKPILLGPSD